LVIEWTEHGRRTEHHIGGIFHLYQAPVVALAEDVQHQAALRGIAVEHTMQFVG
jgi:hypothetical protein